MEGWLSAALNGTSLKPRICVHRKWNVLSKLVVPRIKLSVHYINSELEEIEREDNFRLKRFKELKNKKNKEKEDIKPESRKIYQRNDSGIRIQEEYTQEYLCCQNSDHKTSATGINPLSEQNDTNNFNNFTITEDDKKLHVRILSSTKTKTDFQTTQDENEYSLSSYKQNDEDSYCSCVSSNINQSEKPDDEIDTTCGCMEIKKIYIDEPVCLCERIENLEPDTELSCYNRELLEKSDTEKTVCNVQKAKIKLPICNCEIPKKFDGIDIYIKGSVQTKHDVEDLLNSHEPLEIPEESVCSCKTLKKPSITEALSNNDLLINTEMKKSHFQTPNIGVPHCGSKIQNKLKNNIVEPICRCKKNLDVQNISSKKLRKNNNIDINCNCAISKKTKLIPGTNYFNKPIGEYRYKSKIPKDSNIQKSVSSLINSETTKPMRPEAFCSFTQQNSDTVYDISSDERQEKKNIDGSVCNAIVSKKFNESCSGNPVCSYEIEKAHDITKEKVCSCKSDTEETLKILDTVESDPSSKLQKRLSSFDSIYRCDKTKKSNQTLNSYCKTHNKPYNKKSCSCDHFEKPDVKESIVSFDDLKTRISNFKYFNSSFQSSQDEIKIENDKSFCVCDSLKQTVYRDKSNFSLQAKSSNSEKFKTCCKKSSDKEIIGRIAKSDQIMPLKKEENDSIPIKSQTKVTFKDKKNQTESKSDLPFQAMTCSKENMHNSAKQTMKESYDICENHKINYITNRNDPDQKPYKENLSAVHKSISANSTNLNQSVSESESLVREVNLNTATSNKINCQSCEGKLSASGKNDIIRMSAKGTPNSYTCKVEIITKSEYDTNVGKNKENNVKLTSSTFNIIKMVLLGLNKLDNNTNIKSGENKQEISNNGSKNCCKAKEAEHLDPNKVSACSCNSSRDTIVPSKHQCQHSGYKDKHKAPIRQSKNCSCNKTNNIYCHKSRSLPSIHIPGHTCAKNINENYPHTSKSNESKRNTEYYDIEAKSCSKCKSKMEKEKADDKFCACGKKQSNDNLAKQDLEKRSISGSTKMCPTCKQKLSTKSICGSQNSHAITDCSQTSAKCWNCTSNYSFKSCFSSSGITNCQTNVTIYPDTVMKKDASTSTRRSDRYDVRTLKLLKDVTKSTCSCKSDTAMIRAYKKAHLLRRSRSYDDSDSNYFR